jgi:hypothetical protein
MIKIPNPLRLSAGAALTVALCLTAQPRAQAQGCVAAHTTQPLISGLDPRDQQGIGDRLHGLTLNFGFRTYSSYRHYVGDVYQAQRHAKHNEVQNHVDLFDLGISYQLTPRWSLIADIPGMSATRHGGGSINTYRDGGVGDITAGVQAWVWRPPTESHGNVNFSLSLKAPTGIKNASGTTILAGGATQTRPFDQSIQPGDGGWGFVIASEAYRELYFHTVFYSTGSYLFNPESTNGVRTYRSLPGEQVMSIADQYLYRGGLSHSIPAVHPLLRGLSGSFGGRMEGVPSRDLLGDSKGFRRPGYVISIEPAIMYSHGHNMFNISAPWAMLRDRTTSINDEAANTHGDAAFADFTIIASYTRSF